jgi:8-oxo-dGTP diphosphatase
MSNKKFGLSVRAIIKDQQGRCLLVRRSNLCKHFAGKWEWPGGTANQGETFVQTLVREVSEETGLEVQPRKFVGAFEMDLTTFAAVVICMEADITGGEFKLSPEHTDSCWVPVEDIFNYDLLDAMRDLAKHYIQGDKRKMNV